MLIIHKDRIEHAATRLLTQSQINPEAGPKAFEEYVKIRYPYLETTKKNEKDTAVARMLSEIRKGPLVIKPMSDPSVKSKTFKKVARADHENATEVASRLINKIGRVMPT